MNTYSYDQIIQLVKDFETHQLSKTDWTHEAHLVVAIHHASLFDEAQSMALLRGQIQSFNESVGTVNTDDSGYHETITRTWLRIIHLFVEQHLGMDLSDIVNRFLTSTYTEKTLLLEFYSNDHLMSTQARLDYVEPDLKPVAL